MGGGIWLLVVATALSWLFFLDTFTRETVTLLIPFGFPLFLGMVGGFFHFRKESVSDLSHKIVFLFLFPLAALVWFLPAPYVWAPCFMGAGLLWALIFRGRAGAPLFPLFFFTGSLLGVQGLSTPLIYTLFSRFHEVKALNTLFYPVFRLLGLDASMSEGVVYIDTYRNLMAFPFLLEKAGGAVLVYLLAGGLLVFLLLDRRLKRFLLFLGVLAGYAFLRYVLLTLIHVQVDNAVIYWNPCYTLLSFLPLAPILWWLVPVKTSLPLQVFSSESRVPGGIWFLITLFGAVGCLALALTLHDPGELKKGRILVDEMHSDWEWTAHPFDTSWYGRQSTYNYYCMADYLSHYYRVEDNHEDALSDKLLEDTDILILKTPTKAYGEEEIRAVVRFVEKGGGLWLVGDHTNVFGMSHYLNELAGRFGLFFNYDSTYDLESGRLTRFKRPRLFPHPVVANMPPFLFATSCTLDAPLTADNVMVGYAMRSRLLSYSGRSFFQQEPTTDYEFGLFLQGAAISHGRGRVLAFTDSTCFSNFYMFIPGKPELVLGSMDWLNRKSRPFHELFPWLGAGVFTLLSLGILWGFRSSSGGAFRGAILPVVLLALVSALAGADGLNKRHYPLPEPHTGYRQIAFETGVSNISLPIAALVDKAPNNFHTFFVWTQRLGLFPKVAFDPVEALKGSEMVVLINPDGVFTDAMVQKLTAWVEKGGRLLVLDDPGNKASTAAALLNAFGMGMDGDKPLSGAVIHAESRNRVFQARRAGRVTGGRAILKTPGGSAYFSTRKVGKGLVGGMAESRVFTNRVMGHTQSIPGEKELEIFRLEYFILNTMLNP